MTSRSSSVNRPHFSLTRPLNCFQFPSIRFQSIMPSLILSRVVNISEKRLFPAKQGKPGDLTAACALVTPAQAPGHTVRLMAPKRQKNEAADVICEAVGRPTMRFVATKTLWLND